jgi:hypothetical protein
MISGLPWPSQTACNLEFNPPLVRPIRLRAAPFEQAGRGPMRFQMRAVDQQLIQLTALRRQAGKDLAEHAHAAPADELIIDRLGRSIVGRRIAPAQAVTDDKNDADDNSAIINPWNTIRHWEIGLYSMHLRLR